MDNLLDKIFKVVIPMIIAAACGIITYLSGEPRTMVTGLVSGIYCGIATSLAWEFGKDNWSTESLYTVGGGILGGILGSLIAIG